MRQGLVTEMFLVAVRDEHHWEWIVQQGSTPLISYSYLYVSQHPACCLFREGRWPYHGHDLLRKAAFSYLHALGVRAYWYATLTLSSCQDASNYASRWSEAERGFLCDENWSMDNVILLLPPPQGWFPLSHFSTQHFPVHHFSHSFMTPYGRLIYLVNGSSPGPELCNNLHPLHPGVQYIICGDFSLRHQFLCYQSFFRCLSLGSVMSPDSRVEVTPQSGQPCEWQQLVTPLKWQPPGKWEMDGEAVWRLTVYSLWKLLHPPGWLCQTLFSSLCLFSCQASRNLSIFALWTIQEKHLHHLYLKSLREQKLLLPPVCFFSKFKLSFIFLVSGFPHFQKRAALLYQMLL